VISLLLSSLTKTPIIQLEIDEQIDCFQKRRGADRGSVARDFRPRPCRNHITRW
jgi:hypothetical protein